MKPILSTLAVLAVGAQLTYPALAGSPHHPHYRSTSVRSCPGASTGIAFYREATWRWQEQRGAPRSNPGSIDRSRSCTLQREAARRWRDLAREQRSLYVRWFRSTYAKWECIHRHEGAWNASNDGYGGGLQMDAGFQRTYGAEFSARFGWASNWPVWAQLVAAERAFYGYDRYRARGFTPWPNSSAACGL